MRGLIGMPCLVWNFVCATLITQHVAAWHGYAWSFWQITGYVVLVQLVLGRVFNPTSAQLLALHKRTCGAEENLLLITTQVFAQTVAITVAWLIVRSL